MRRAVLRAGSGLTLLATVLVPSPEGGAAAPPAPAPMPRGQTAAAGAPAPEPPPFQEWLIGVRADALVRGISARTLDRALARLEPLMIVVQRDRMQAEFTLSLDAYLQGRLSPRYVRDVRAALARDQLLLRKVADAYGVPPHVIVSVWAVESNLGRFSGLRPTIQTLATLAWEGRRAAFFRGQLLDALAIVDSGDIELERLKGSWAGAMGQPQFMPSSYLRYAQDFDGDGRRDIWRSLPDVFASIASYLKENGWSPEGIWGREVRLPPGADAAIAAATAPRERGCRAARELTEPLPLARWTKLGLRSVTGGPLPRADRSAGLLRAGSRSFLVYDNYDALLAYNCAHAYALSVGLLSDRVK